MDYLKKSDVTANLRLAVIGAASLVLHAVFIFGTTFDIGNNTSEITSGQTKSTVLSVLLIPRNSNSPASEKQLSKQSEQTPKVAQDNSVQNKTAINTNEAVKVTENNSLNITTQTRAASPESSSKAPPETELTETLPKDLSVPENSMPSGVELVKRALEYIHSENFRKKDGETQIFNPMLRELLVDPFKLKSITGDMAGVDSYVRNDGRTIVKFNSRGGKFVCAEIREKDLLDDFDRGSWSILSNGC